MLVESFGWTVTFLSVCSIACQVILEDLIVCATAEMRADLIQVKQVIYKGEGRTKRHIDLMRRMQL
jgi:hypothetical protein